MEAIESEGEELRDVGLLGGRGEREEACHRQRRRLVCSILGLHLLTARQICAVTALSAAGLLRLNKFGSGLISELCDSDLDPLR